VAHPAPNLSPQPQIVVLDHYSDIRCVGRRVVFGVRRILRPEVLARIPTLRFEHAVPEAVGVVGPGSVVGIVGEFDFAGRELVSLFVFFTGYAIVDGRA
jgi:hypothetical protein